MPLKFPIERKLLSLREAAAIAGRSYSWAQNCAADGRLYAVRQNGRREVRILADSLAELLSAEQPACASPARSAKCQGLLRLVVDNTSK